MAACAVVLLERGIVGLLDEQLGMAMEGLSNTKSAVSYLVPSQASVTRSLTFGDHTYKNWQKTNFWLKRPRSHPCACSLGGLALAPGLGSSGSFAGFKDATFTLEGFSHGSAANSMAQLAWTFHILLLLLALSLILG
eukprot:4459053-Amphidinium_carterae.1